MNTNIFELVKLELYKRNFRNLIFMFIEPACSERDIVATRSLKFVSLCVCKSVSVSVLL